MNQTAKRKVFFSFHFKNDIMRVQLVRNIGAIDENKPLTANEWEQIKIAGDESIQRWIDEHMKNKSCVVVLVGTETNSRPWIKYEIVKGWNDKKGIVGIYIHNLPFARTGNCSKGHNPFDDITIGDNGPKLSSVVKCYDPSSRDAYDDITKNINAWICS
jgi:hypothetical protein